MEKLSQYKSLIEENTVVMATVMMDGKPNAICVGSVKVVGDDRLLITDNYMNQTVKDIQGINNVCLIIIDAEQNCRKFVGTAEYFTEGKWKLTVEQMPENKGYSAKGAILVTVSKIIESK